MADDRRKRRAAELIEPLRVKPGSKVTLGEDFDPSFKAGVRKKKEGVALLQGGVQLLAEDGIRVVKLFLNLSQEEQRIRFLRRLDLPDHNWKFAAADVTEREHWEDYQKAFSEMLSHTSTEWAPWYVIPADRKWFGRIGAGAVIVHTRMEADPLFPTVSKKQRDGLVQIKRELEAQAPDGAHADPFEHDASS